MQFKLIIASLLVVLTFALSGSLSASAQTNNAQQTKTKKYVPSTKIVVVQYGDSLSVIARKHKTSYPRIYDANPKLDNPDLIFSGDKIRVPSPHKKLKHRTLPSSYIASSVPVRSYSQPQTAPAPVKVIHPAVSSSGVWDQLASCESGGNWAINTGNGYYGGLQFTLSSWRGVGGSGYPNQASREEQIARGKLLQASSGWGAWPACASRLGLL